MKHRRRKAQFEAPLVIYDGVQLACLKSKKSLFLALAIPEDILGEFDFLVATANDKSLTRYFDGEVDLRFIFTFAPNRMLYKMKSKDLAQKNIWLTPFERKTVPEECLPQHGLFSRDHTHEYAKAISSSDEERLFIDGEWEMTEFGKFYQKFSDVYSFVAAIYNFNSSDNNSKEKALIKSAFRNKPFQGGSSYLHLFTDLNRCVPREQKLTLDAIQYASPGDVKVNGYTPIFSEEKKLILNFLDNRSEIMLAYNDLYTLLQKNKLLTLSGEKFDPGSYTTKHISELAKKLCDLMLVADYEQLKTLSENNTLVTAKILLAVKRRLETATSFFAEGRMAYER